MPQNMYKPKTLWKTKSTGCVFLRSGFAKKLLSKINFSITQLFYAITALTLLISSDVHGPASGRGPGQAGPGQSHGLTTALAWPEILESRSRRLRPRLLSNIFLL